MNNNKESNKSSKSSSSTAASSTSTSTSVNESNLKQLQPLKTIFLNKYEQLKKPTLSPNNNNNELSTLIADNNTSGALIFDPSQHQHHPQQQQQQHQQQQHQQQLHHLNADLTGTASINYNNSSLIYQSNPVESSQLTYQSYNHPSGSTTKERKFSMPSTSSKSTPPPSAPAPTTTAATPSTSGSMKRHLSGSNSSLQNSDDDDDYDETATAGANTPYLSGLNYSTNSRSKEEKRRLSHTAAEQKRRNAIKRGYDELQSIVPSCDFMDPSSSQKVCKATVLKRCYELLQNVVPSCQPTDPIISTRITRATTLEQTIDYIHELQKEKDRHDQELDSLKKEITALKIMRQNYDEMLQYHRNQPQTSPIEVNDEAKFELFVKYSDNLFHSFQSMINPTTFSDLSSSLFNWLEQAFSANNLKSIAYLTLVQAAQQMFR